jgi:hypothetical protein
MKPNELNRLIEETLVKEVKKSIFLLETDKKEVYQIMCDGEPLGVYDTQEEAEQEKEKIKGLKPGQELIIDKITYESYQDMIEKLDQMGEELEKNENMENYNMDEEYETNEGNEFTKALKDAKDAGEDTFTVDGKTYDVEECWSKMNEEDLSEDDMFVTRDDFAQIDPNELEEMDMEDGSDSEPTIITSLEDLEDEDSLEENMGSCNECGAMLNEEGMCTECGIKENKKVLRVTESKLVGMIKEMVNEAMKGVGDTRGVSGQEVTKRAQKGSKKENDSYLKDVEKKMKDYLNIDGSDNPEFPHQVGKGDKAAINLTSDQEDEVDMNQAGLQNLDYDVEPSDKFKERMKMAIEGDSKMGNAPTTPKPSIKPSNNAEKGKEAKEKIGNVNNSKKAELKLLKQIKNRDKEKKERVLYNKQTVPVKHVTNESKNSDVVLTEELKRMKNISSYNKKTQ